MRTCVNRRVWFVFGGAEGNILALGHFEPSTSAMSHVYGFLPVLLKLFIPVKVSKPIFRSLLEPLAVEYQ